MKRSATVHGMALFESPYFSHGNSYQQECDASVLLPRGVYLDGNGGSYSTRYAYEDYYDVYNGA